MSKCLHYWTVRLGRNTAHERLHGEDQALKAILEIKEEMRDKK